MNEGGSVGAYLRVSSRSQSVDTQRDAIERAARARGDQIGQWWAETRSAATSERVELSKVRGAARRGELRRLYVYRLDRLCRTGIRDTLTLLEEFDHCGVQLVSVADNFDPSGPMGSVVVAVLAWAAQVERTAIGERIASAKERMAAEGRPWGRPSSLKQSDIDYVIDRAKEGLSVREIATAINAPKSTVGDLLKRLGVEPAKLSGKPPFEPKKNSRE